MAHYRYMGASATISIRDTCDGLRMHINNRLHDKGHAEKEYYFDSPSDTVGAIGTPCSMSRQPDMPPEKLVDLLLEAFFDRLHSLFPIVQYSEIQKLYHRALLGDTESDFIPVLFAILAVATPLVELNHSVFQEPECEPYRHGCLATYFYAIARNCLEQGESTSVRLGSLEVPLTNERNSIWKVQGWGLVSMYLAGAGSEAEAWVVVGRAVRLGQDLGLHVGISLCMQLI
ncbi:hypothetical protein LTR85_007757 [Meristemomyces frigidus]|nr:hypothetical protein LTR85_007757 [Meristemomyces frigidus]